MKQSSNNPQHHCLRACYGRVMAGVVLCGRLLLSGEWSGKAWQVIAGSGC